MKMLEHFEDDDDVQNVYHNMEITDKFWTAPKVLDAFKQFFQRKEFGTVRTL